MIYDGFYIRIALLVSMDGSVLCFRSFNHGQVFWFKKFVLMS